MRWIVRFVFGVAVLVVLALGVLALIPAERVTAAVSAEFEAATGRKLLLSGAARPRLWPTLGVTTGPVSIANAPWAEGEALFRADSLSVDVNMGALLGGEVRITGLVATNPAIVLERAKDGRVNWTLGAGDAEGAVPAPVTAFTLDEGRINGGSLRFIDRQTGRDIALDGMDGTLRIPDFAGPFSLSLTGFSNGVPVAAKLSGGVFSAFLAGRVVPLTASLAAGEARIALDGRAGLSPLMAQGALTAQLSDLPALGQAADIALARPGPGLGRDSLSIAGTLTLDGTGAVFLRDATLVADGNSLSGDLDLLPGEARPKLVGALTAGPLTLGEAPTGKDGTGTGTGGWPTEKIDVSALGGLDAEVALAAPSVMVNGLALGETRLLVTLDRARAVTTIRRLAAYGGQVTGEFVVNGRGGLSVGGALNLAGMDMQAVLSDLAGYDRLATRGDLEVKFLGVGNSVDAIMKSLGGSGSFQLGEGTLRGIDIPAMLQKLDPSFVGEDRTTRFEGLAGTFVIADGVLTNNDLKLVAPSLTASGAGRVGLGDRTLDYGLRPTALVAADGTGGVMVPLLITGPWSAPRFRLDLEGIAREKMEAEARAAAAKIEARAKAELEERLTDELGVEVAPGESMGDAAGRAAEQALQDETRRALERILGGD